MAQLTITAIAHDRDDMYRVTFRDESGARGLGLFGEFYLAGLLAAAQVKAFDETLIGRRVEARLVSVMRADDVAFYASAESFARIPGELPPAVAAPAAGAAPMRSRVKRAG